jgi:hypothetical protein
MVSVLFAYCHCEGCHAIRHVQFDSIIGLVCNLLFESSYVCIVALKTWSTESCAVSSIFVSWRIVSTQCLKVKQQRANSEGIMRALLFDSPSVGLTCK